MADQKRRRPRPGQGNAGSERRSSGRKDTAAASALQAGPVAHEALIELCLHLLGGCHYAAAAMRSGKPGPIRLPDDRSARRELVLAHLAGSDARIIYARIDCAEQPKIVSPLVLFGLCPAADGGCRWLGIDLDAADGHGDGGLVDPPYAARCVAERADAFGLIDGLIVARSRSGKGLHMWLILPEPTPLTDAVLGLAYLAGMSMRVAHSDAVESGQSHAFRTGAGGIARLGQAGAVELIPRSMSRPERGWSLLLPGSGALASHGGGIIVDPFSGKPIQLERVPPCNPDAWTEVVARARELHERHKPEPRPAQHRPRPASSRDPLGHIDQRTRAFLDGQVEPGARNQTLYAATCNLLGVGVEPAEANELTLAGAIACGLSEREAKSVVRSAFRQKGVTV